MALGLNYSTPGYSPGKLVDEFGQGSSNDNYGRTIKVTAADQIADYLPSNTVPYGASRANRVPWLRLLDALALVAVPVLFITGRRTAAAFVFGAVVVDVVARRASPNFDSAMSMIPFNRAAEA